MDKEKIFETVGYITKKEKLSSVVQDTDGALILETREPYPGYHGANVPNQLIPLSLFLITDKKYSGESVIRATMEVKKHFLDHFDAAPGLVSLFNSLAPCIRIKDMASYYDIHNLIVEYRKAGIDFLKNKEIDPYDGLIKVRKYFSLNVCSEGLYCDVDNPAQVYFEIDGLISWEKFEEITYGLKPNVEFNNFDAALGVFFTPKGVIDNIRIFHPEIKLEDVNYLREKYLIEIDRRA